MRTSAPELLRALLARGELVVMPCCFDALSAKLVEQAGFPLTFMSGFAASAARIAEPDLGLMSYGEVLDQGRNICAAVDIPVIADGDTGYGNAMNVRRTVDGFARAGFAGVMIEDQVAPKRCGHTRGKQVVGRGEACERVQAAVDVRDAGADILIVARTDARHEHGLEEAIERAAHFEEIGADILFVEAPASEEEMRTICSELSAPSMANIVEGGMTPELAPAQLAEIGYTIAAYPLTLLSAAMNAMITVLERLQAGAPAGDMLLDFQVLRDRVGFEDYYRREQRYMESARPETGGSGSAE